MQARQKLLAFFRSPWTAAALSAAGVTLLILGGLALLLPPDLLDRVWPLGDRLLVCSLTGLFVASGVVARLLGSSRSDQDGALEAELPAAATVSPQSPGGNQIPQPATSRHLR